MTKLSKYSYDANHSINNKQNKMIFHRVHPDNQIPEMWIHDVETNKNVLLSEKGGNLSMFQESWSLDDKYYYFNRSHGLDNEIYDDYLDISRINVETGEIERITNNTDFQVQLGFISDTELLLVSNKDNAFNYFILNTKNGELEKISNLSLDAFQFKYEYLQSKINMNNKEFTYCDGNNLFIYDWEKRNHQIIDIGISAIDLGWIDNNNIIVQSLQNQKFYKVDKNNKEVKELPDIKIPCSYMIATSDNLIFSKFAHDTSGCVYLDIYNHDGTFKESISIPSLSFASRNMRSTQNFGDDSVYLTLSGFGKKPILIKYDFDSNNYNSFMNNDGKDNFNITYKPYKSADNRTIYTYIIKPDSNENNPVIIFPHGGPVAKNMNIYDPELSALLDKGFTVVTPNYSGSTGYGKAFQDLLTIDKNGKGGFGDREIEDIDYLIDELFQYPDIDQSRINMMGVSYGGYMTYLYAVKGKHKDKISTYAPIAGITSWNLYHDEDIKEKYKIAALSQKVWMRRRLLPNVFVDDELEKQTAFEFLKERSPLTHIKNLERPMIVFQAINDERTPIEQTRIFVQKLNEYHDQNIPFKFKYKEVNFNHAGSLTNDIIDEITNFMNSESNNETLSASRINR